MMARSSSLEYWVEGPLAGKAAGVQAEKGQLSLLSPCPREAKIDSLLLRRYRITGNVFEMAVAAGVQAAWPQPLALTPIMTRAA